MTTKLLALLIASTSLLACTDDDNDGPDGDEVAKDGPDDGRRPELDGKPSTVLSSKISMANALTQAATTGAVIEAKFELDGTGKLSLSTYPIGAPLAMDSERSKFQELAGDPTAASWQPALEVFHDLEHLTRSSRDLTLVQLSKLSINEAVAQEASRGFVYWVIPTIHAGRAGYGVFAVNDAHKDTYKFVDGGGEASSQILDLGANPGADATDARGPELGDNAAVARTSKITMAAALAHVEASHGPAIEAKFELGDDDKLSLSVYPVGDMTKSAEQNKFVELAGDPTVATWSPGSEEFAVPDEEHLTRAARDLTLVQTAKLSLRDAVAKADAKFPGGFVYWAIPTRRGTQSGYGIYVLDAQNVTHYLFVS
jgi:hypothetical protein